MNEELKKKLEEWIQVEIEPVKSARLPSLAIELVPLLIDYCASLETERNAVQDSAFYYVSIKFPNVSAPIIDKTPVECNDLDDAVRAAKRSRKRVARWPTDFGVDSDSFLKSSLAWAVFEKLGSEKPLATSKNWTK